MYRFLCGHMFISLGYIFLVVELLGHMVTSFFNMLRNCQTAFPKLLHHFILFYFICLFSSYSILYSHQQGMISLHLHQQKRSLPVLSIVTLMSVSWCTYQLSFCSSILLQASGEWKVVLTQGLGSSASHHCINTIRYVWEFGGGDG